MHKSRHVLVAIAKTYSRVALPAALGVALMVGCADSQDKRVPPSGEGGEAGAAGEASSVAAGASTQAGTGGVGGAGGPGAGAAGDGGAVAGAGAGAAALGGAPGSSEGQGGVANGGDGAGTQAGAGAAGADNEPAIPVSVCGPGKWFAGEGLCAECPAAPEVVELSCADYASAQVLTTTAGQLQYVFASLPSDVQAHEASPVELSVTYLTPNEAHVRLLRFITNGWNVDLRQAPDPPQTVIVPPFSTADVCGAVFHSTEPVRFDRVAGPTVSYSKVCP